MAQPVKVWSSDRSKRKMVVVSTLEELLSRGAAKLGLTGLVTAHLEEDGTEIDEEDLFLINKDKTYILVEEGKEWVPAVVRPSTPVREVDVSDNQDKVDIHVNTAQTPCTSTETGLPPLNLYETPRSRYSSPQGHVRVNSTTPLPIFSDIVESGLHGDPTKIWSSLVNESAHHYQKYHGDMKSVEEYRAVGEAMYRRYPNIARAGTHPWSVFVKTLSARCRHLRWQDRMKTRPPTQHSKQVKRLLESPGDVPSCKRRVLMSPMVSSGTLSEEDWEAHLGEMKNESDKNDPNMAHLKVLHRETFSKNQEWILTVPDGNISTILEKIPGYRFPPLIVHDLKLVLGEDAFAKCTGNMQQMLQALAKVKGVPYCESEPEFVLQMLQYVETSTKLNKGKGLKSRTLVDVKEDIPDGEMTSSLTTKEFSAPHLAVMQRDMEIQGVFLIGDGETIRISKNDMPSAIQTLMAFYYVFNMEYPRIYSQALGFLQQYLLGQPYKGKKSRGFYLLETEVNKVL